MDFVTSADNLKKAIGLTSHFISPKSQLPILGNILITTSKTGVSFSATNLENAVSTKIPAKVTSEGEITVPGKTLLDIISNLANEVEISLEKEKITISSNSFKSEILGLNAMDFPKTSSSINKEDLVIEKQVLNKCLTETLFSLSLDETRPVLTGLLFDFDGTDLFLVSTDGFRLSKTKVKAKKLPKNVSKTVVPKNILYEILKNDTEGDVSVSFDNENSQFLASLGETLYSSKIIEGQFPDYNKIIPKGHKLRILVDKEEFTKAVKLASVFARDAGNIIKLKVKSEKLIVISENQTTGNQESEIDAKVESDVVISDFEISYNYKFIEDYLKVLDADEAIIEFNEEGKAGKFLNSKNKDFLHLIMPIKG